MTKQVKTVSSSRVLLIGSGRRIQNNFLPALNCLKDEFGVMGIYSRTKANLIPVAERWGVPAFSSLEDVNFDMVNVIAISVPTASNAVVLGELHKYIPNDKLRRLQLVIDTPVSWNRSEFRAILAQLYAFGHVAIAEDYMNYPPFSLLRRAISESLIGQPKALVLTNTGYLYHGLALIRSFVDFQPALLTSRTRFGNYANSVTYRFRGGFEGHVIGPYRSHTTGGFVLEGTKGSITEFPADRDRDSKTSHLLYFRRIEGLLKECVIESASEEMIEPMPSISQMAELPFENKSDLNLLRSCGLMTVFRSLIDPNDFNNKYGIMNALYDSFISQRATYGRFPFDPFVFFKSNAVNVAARMMSSKYK